ncbi:Nuclear control of ATPase protein 2 [Pichia californica]|uniref:Nuclear control of ATPase protein 2 n=1 Tax=Pichia californica TaxID=460514 RepID=A0A9P6WKT8_9ASCO|nr:Nuclear control of ATPase protein 2 [[Candida] californica]KAG0688857.1 Nuclear control of ATPase protein 2 [[Candida] californica]
MSTLTFQTFLSPSTIKELQDRALIALSEIEKQENDTNIPSIKLNELSIVKSSFIDLYQIVKPGINHNALNKATDNSYKQDFSNNTTTINKDFILSSNDINILVNIIDKIKSKNWLQSTDIQIKLLSQIMVLFISIILMLEISKTLINSTLNSLNDINYYDCILSKNYTILLYFIQTLPLNIYSLIKNIENYLIPINIEYNEIPNWIPDFSKEFYKLILGYSKFTYKFIKSNIITFLQSPTSFLIEKRINYSNSLFNKFWNSTFKLPYYYSKFNIEFKRKNLLNLQKDNIFKLGYLLSNPPTIQLKNDNNEINFKISNKIFNLNNDDFLNLIDSNNFNINDLYNAFNLNLPNLKLNLKNKLINNSKPNYFIRNWPIIIPTILLIGSYLASTFKNIKLLINDNKIRNEFFNYLNNLLNYFIETSLSFWNNWIINPINNILKTIRHDNNSEIALMSKQSLNSDLDSLERMTIDYIADSNKDIDIEFIKNSIKNGDMTLIMNNYENDLKNPIKSIIIGDMIRNILIQIQKTKVDGSLALNGVDQILKSQELVFGFVAASPSLFILWNFKNSFIKWYNGNYENSFKNIQNTEIKNLTCKSLGNIEKIIDFMVIKKNKNKNQLENQLENKINYYKIGLLFIELRNLKQLSSKLLSSYVLTEFINDLEELIDNNLDIDYKLLTVQRIWNVYGGYFK